MGDLVQFPMERVRGRGSSVELDCAGEVVLFTGVRYERANADERTRVDADSEPQGEGLTDAVADGDRGGAKLS